MAVVKENGLIMARK